MLGTKEEPLSLATLLDGAVVERFDQVLQEVISNINDPNTPATAKREIDLRVTFKPTDDDRFITKITVECVPKLPGAKAIFGACVIGSDVNGVVEAREIINAQQNLFGKEKSDKITPIRKGVDGNA